MPTRRRLCGHCAGGSAASPGRCCRPLRTWLRWRPVQCLRIRFRAQSRALRRVRLNELHFSRDLRGRRCFLRIDDGLSFTEPSICGRDGVGNSGGGNQGKNCNLRTAHSPFERTVVLVDILLNSTNPGLICFAAKKRSFLPTARFFTDLKYCHRRPPDRRRAWSLMRRS